MPTQPIPPIPKRVLSRRRAAAGLLAGLFLAASPDLWAGKGKGGGGGGGGGGSPSYSVYVTADPDYPLQEPTITGGGSDGLHGTWTLKNGISGTVTEPQAILPIEPRGSGTTLNRGYLQFTVKRGKIQSVMFWLKQELGSEFPTYRTEDIPLDPPVDPSDAGPIHVHLDGVLVFEEKSRMPLGEISVGDIDLVPVTP